MFLAHLAGVSLDDERLVVVAAVCSLELLHALFASLRNTRNRQDAIIPRVRSHGSHVYQLKFRKDRITPNRLARENGTRRELTVQRTRVRTIHGRDIYGHG